MLNIASRINGRPIKAYVDFDGTISKQDIINSVLDQYAAPVWIKLDKLYLDGKISSYECLGKQIALLSDLPDSKMLEVAEKVGIDKSFKDFCDFCDVENIEIEIVSDGLDIYIKHLLKINGIHVKKIKSNIYKGHGIIEFPYHAQLCNKKCANCKKSHLDNNSFIIYIGDGSSDKCAAMNSDLVFAKKSLAQYLNKESKPYKPFKSFADIKNSLSLPKV